MEEKKLDFEKSLKRLDEIVNKIVKDKDVLVEQRSRATVQLVTM